jgi:hypothetical protein
MARNPCVSLQRISVTEQMVSVDHRILAQGAGAAILSSVRPGHFGLKLNDILAPPNLVMAAQEVLELIYGSNKRSAKV